MTLTLFDLTYRTARELGIVTEGTATGGSATTIIDTVERTEAEHHWKGGAVWILYDALGTGVSPQGKYGVVTAFASDTSTITFSPTATDAVAAGDRYAVGKAAYPLNAIISAVNRALSEIKIVTYDTTTVDAVASKTEYSIAVAANLDLRQVWLQTQLNDANDNKWAELLNWRVQRVGAGTADLLVFPYQPCALYDVMLVYAAPHSPLYVYSDKLADNVDYRRVIYKAAYYLLLDKQLETGREDRVILDAMRRYEQRAQEADDKFPINLPRKPGKLMIPEV